jgi:hypothetical protein
MTTSKEWEVRRRWFGAMEYENTVVETKTSEVVCVLPYIAPGIQNDSDRTARLIAAAPDMLNALRLVLNDFVDQMPHEIVEAASRAWGKAGESTEK